MKQQYIAVIVIVFNEKGEILLTKRNQPSSKHAHGRWQFPGGGIEFGEHPKETALREVQEETGVIAQLLAEEPKVFSHVYTEHNVHVTLLAYPARYLSGELTGEGDPDNQTGDVQWFAYRDIDFTNSLPLTKEILDEIQGSL